MDRKIEPIERHDLIHRVRGKDICAIGDGDDCDDGDKHLRDRDKVRGVRGADQQGVQRQALLVLEHSP